MTRMRPWQLLAVLTLVFQYFSVVVSKCELELQPDDKPTGVAVTWDPHCFTDPNEYKKPQFRACGWSERISRIHSTRIGSKDRSYDITCEDVANKSGVRAVSGAARSWTDKSESDKEFAMSFGISSGYLQGMASVYDNGDKDREFMFFKGMMKLANGSFYGLDPSDCYRFPRDGGWTEMGESGTWTLDVPSRYAIGGVESIHYKEADNGAKEDRKWRFRLCRHAVVQKSDYDQRRKLKSCYNEN